MELYYFTAFATDAKTSKLIAAYAQYYAIPEYNILMDHHARFKFHGSLTFCYVYVSGPTQYYVIISSGRAPILGIEQH